MRHTLQIIKAAESADLATLAELKRYMGITSNIADGALGVALSATSMAFQLSAGRILVQETVRETFGNLLYPNRVYLNRYPVTEVYHVAVGGKVLQQSEFQLRRTHGQLTFSHDVPAESEVEISYVGGYSPEVMPPDIKLAVLASIAWVRSHSRTHDMLPPEADEVAKSYRIARTGL